LLRGTLLRRICDYLAQRILLAKRHYNGYDKSVTINVQALNGGIIVNVISLAIMYG